VKNKIPWIVGGILIVGLAVGAIFLGQGPEEPPSVGELPESARAVVIPANEGHKVVIPPCNTPVEQTTTDAERGKPTPGATTFQLPKGKDVRTVLVPHCQPGTGAVNTAGNIPSSAFVVDNAPAANTTDGAFESDGVIAKSQLLVQKGGDGTTIVVPPCGKTTKGEDAVLEAKNGSELVVAAEC
jgi:hypothetical protein